MHAAQRGQHCHDRKICQVQPYGQIGSYPQPCQEQCWSRNSSHVAGSMLPPTAAGSRTYRYVCPSHPDHWQRVQSAFLSFKERRYGRPARIFTIPLSSGPNAALYGRRMYCMCQLLITISTTRPSCFKVSRRGGGEVPTCWCENRTTRQWKVQ